MFKYLLAFTALFLLQTSLPGFAQELSAKERARFLKEDFVPITAVQSIPHAVAQNLGIDGKSNEMANPGGAFSVGCTGGPDVPHTRLIQAGRSRKDDRCFVFFESGGIAYFCTLRLYDTTGGKAILLAETHLQKPFAKLAELKAALRNARAQ